MGRFCLFFDPKYLIDIVHWFLNPMLVCLCLILTPCLDPFLMKIRDHRNFILCNTSNEITIFGLSLPSFFLHFSGIDFCLVFSITCNSFGIPQHLPFFQHEPWKKKVIRAEYPEWVRASCSRPFLNIGVFGFVWLPFGALWVPLVSFRPLGFVFGILLAPYSSRAKPLAKRRQA